MLIKPHFRLVALLAFSLIGYAITPVANAQCGCPSDGNGAPKAAATGLGQSFPNATDLSPDPNWQVYKFEGSGIEYFQVNDQSGVVHAATGRIGDTVWAMPMGVDAGRVAVPGDALPAGSPRVLYRGQDVEVVLYQDGTKQRWLIRAPVQAISK